MSHLDPERQTSHAAHIAGISARERALILGAITFAGTLIVALAIPGGNPPVEGPDPSASMAVADPGLSQPPPSSVAPSPEPTIDVAWPAEIIAWTVTPIDHLQAIGETFEYECPANPTPFTGWEVTGTDIYTVDSSVCMAALHAGVITLEGGGRVAIVMRAGADSFAGTTRNGVTSLSWGESDRGFEVIGLAEAPPPPTGPWAAHAMDHRGAFGEMFAYECPANGTSGPIWGSAIYTDDSSVCTAAVHMGLITFESGGTVRIVMRPGLSSYASTSLNGVTSEAWDAWQGSFHFAVP